MATRRNRFKFTGKRQSIKGIIALSVAVILLVLYLIFFSLAYKSYGGLSAYYGSVGILAIIFTIVNLVITIQSMCEENSYQLIPRCALGFTILEALLWVGTLILGLRG